MLTKLEKAKEIHYRLTRKSTKQSYTIAEIEQFSKLYDDYVEGNEIILGSVTDGNNGFKHLITVTDEEHRQVVSNLNIMRYPTPQQSQYSNRVDSQESYRIEAVDRDGRNRELTPTEMFQYDGILEEFDEISQDNEYMFETDEEREERKRKFIQDELEW